MTKTERFLHKLRFKYKLTILNENTLEETWHIHLSRLTVFLFCFGIAVLYFFLIAALIIYTPLRTFMPGYTDANVLRKQVLVQAMLVDSIQEQAVVNKQYLDMLQRVVSGQVAVDDSTLSIAGLVNSDISKYDLAQSDKERAFCSQYEIDQRYTTITTTSESTRNLLMYRPASGVIIQEFSPLDLSYGVTISIEPQNSIYSILDGCVISSGYSDHGRYNLQIQHSDNMVSSYKFTQPFFKHKGESVHAGEVLATAAKDVGTTMTFELWIMGKAQNPHEYISFNQDKQVPKVEKTSKKGRQADTTVEKTEKKTEKKKQSVQSGDSENNTSESQKSVKKTNSNNDVPAEPKTEDVSSEVKTQVVKEVPAETKPVDVEKPAEPTKPVSEPSSEE